MFLVDTTNKLVESTATKDNTSFLALPLVAEYELPEGCKSVGANEAEVFVPVVITNVADVPGLIFVAVICVVAVFANVKVK